MTEIPEHLLKRSQSAKAKATGATEPAEGGATPAAAVAKTDSAPPAVAAKALPAKAAAPAAPPQRKPDPPYVKAAKDRKKIPFWAMATLSILPVWVFMYARSLAPSTAKVSGPLGAGAGLYKAGCSGCHGGNGEGGAGYAFAGGEVLKTFPHIEDQLRWVYAGTSGYSAANVSSYGNPKREPVRATGAKGIMPSQGASFGGGLSELEILEVVCHERYTLGGANPTADNKEEFEKWCAAEAPAYLGLEDGSLTFDNIGTTLKDTFPVGTKPAPGHSPDDKP